MGDNFEPLKDGWFKPRETARYLIDHASTKYIIFLMIVLTVVNATINGGSKGNVDVDYLWINFIVVVIFSPLIGVASFGLSAFFTWIIGKIVKGQGSFKDLFKALVGANIPMLLAFPFILTWAILEPQSYVNQNYLSNTPIELIASLMLLISVIWCFVNMIIAISEAHRFSIGNALFTVFIPGIGLFILLIILL